MTRQEFDEVKGIALDMKDSGQTKVLSPTPIIVAEALVQVIVAQPSVQEPSIPYLAIVQQKPLKKRKDQVEKKIEVETPSTQRNYTRLEKTKKVETPSPQKRVKEIASGQEKRRKTLQISSSKFEEEARNRPVQPTT